MIQEREDLIEAFKRYLNVCVCCYVLWGKIVGLGAMQIKKKKGLKKGMGGGLYRKNEKIWIPDRWKGRIENIKEKYIATFPE